MTFNNAIGGVGGSGLSAGGLIESELTQRLAPAPTGVAATDTAAMTALLAASLPGDAIVFHGGTYVLSSTFRFLQNRAYIGNGSTGSAATVFQMAASANLHAVWAADMWFSASVTPSAEFPVIIRDICFDANASAQASGDGHGLVGMNFNSVVQDCKAKNTRGDGFRWSASTRAGNDITSGTSGENHFIRLRTGDGTADNITGDGIRSVDTTAGLIPDCWLVDCIPTGALLNGVRIDNAKGWIVRGNHPSINKMSALRIGRAYMTEVTGNYCEGYGSSVTAGVYCGIDMSTSGVQGGAVIVANNIVWANSDVIATSTCRGIAFTVDTSITAENCSIVGNSGFGRTDTISTSGLLINCQAGGTFEGGVTGNSFKGWAVNYHIGSGTVKVAASGNGGTNVINETFSATPTIPSAKAGIMGMWRMILTANVTATTITDGVDGQRIVIQAEQDGTGGRTMAAPSNAVNWPTIDTTASAITEIHATYLASTDSWYCVLASAAAATRRSNLGLVIGTDVQAFDADLSAIAALTSAANKMPYSTGAQAWALADLSSAARTLLAGADIAAINLLLGRATCKQSSTLSISSSTLADAVGMAFAVTANVRYLFRMTIEFTSADVTVGVKVNFTGPALTSGQYALHTPLARPGSTTAEWAGQQPMYTQHVSSAVGATATPYLLEISGSFEPSASGTVQLQVANETGTTSSSATAGAGELVSVG